MTLILMTRSQCKLYTNVQINASYSVGADGVMSIEKLNYGIKNNEIKNTRYDFR